MYSETTHGITVTVRPVFLDEQSAPAENRYVWAYFVRIENGSDRTVTLRSRWWHITDARGRVQEVRGAGVVGEQPRLPPGASYEEIRAAFRWRIPARYNIGVDVCDRHAAAAPARPRSSSRTRTRCGA